MFPAGQREPRGMSHWRSSFGMGQMKWSLSVRSAGAHARANHMLLPESRRPMELSKIKTRLSRLCWCAKELWTRELCGGYLADSSCTWPPNQHSQNFMYRGPAHFLPISRRTVIDMTGILIQAAPHSSFCVYSWRKWEVLVPACHTNI